MDRNQYSLEVDKKLEILKFALMKYLPKQYDYVFAMLDWYIEESIKNYYIKIDNKKEKSQRRRQRVYWVDFGTNVGSEFNYPHFCVVIKEFPHLSVVVPISTVKEDNPEWKCEDNLIIEIGCLEDLPGEKKPCYAMVDQIKAVSKQRLSDYRENGKYYKVELNNDQMRKIDDAIKLFCKNN